MVQEQRLGEALRLWQRMERQATRSSTHVPGVPVPRTLESVVVHLFRA